MLNTAIIMGSLTADPELRKTTSGLSVTSFTVAVERNYKSGEERQADFINVVADNVSFCGSKAESGNTYGAARQEAPAVSYQSADAGSFSVLPDDNQGFPFGSDDDEGLPF